MDATLLSGRAEYAAHAAEHADPVAKHLARFAATYGVPSTPAAPLEATWEALRAAGVHQPGLAFAAWAEITVLGGLLGPIAVNSPDVGSLLDDLERFHPLFGRERIVLTRRPHAVALSLRAPDGRPTNPDTIESCFALLCRIVHATAGSDAGPHRVALRRARPDDTSSYEAAFGRMPVFGQPADICVFTSETLRLPVSGADAVVREMLRPYAERRIAHRERDRHTSWATTVTTVLHQQSRPDLAQAARTLAVSPRTLQARLTQEGTSFAALTDDLRHERALTLIAQPDLSITTIAARLGFATPSALTRAFRRWTGVSPSAYRREADAYKATEHPPREHVTGAVPFEAQ